MDDSGDAFFVPPPPESETAGDDNNFFAAPPSPDIAPCRGGGRLGRPRAPERSGSVGVWLISREAQAPGASSSSSAVLQDCCDALRCEGLAALTWAFAEEHAAAGGGVGNAYWGTVCYALDDMYQFDVARDLPPGCDVQGSIVPRHLEEQFWEVSLRGWELSVGELLDSHTIGCSRVLVFDRDELTSLFACPPPVALRTVSLGARVDRSSLLADLPPRSALARGKGEANARNYRGRRRGGGGAAGVLSKADAVCTALPKRRAKRRHPDELEGEELPEQPSKKMDPLRLLNAISFANHLRKTADFGEALQDARRYETNDFTEAETRDATNDPKKATLQAAAKRLDLVGMNIERRIWAGEVANDEVQAINCYSDSSPVVGTEIQGMVVDVCKTNGSLRRVILPGGSVAYGLQDAICKVMVFLWAVWLCFGPDLHLLRYFVDHVVCWTTDFGVESHSVEHPDCLTAFLYWVGGRNLQDCRQFVDWTSRLFKRSIRISGWNHSMGNVMKRVAKSYIYMVAGDS